MKRTELKVKNVSDSSLYALFEMLFLLPLYHVFNLESIANEICYSKHQKLLHILLLTLKKLYSLRASLIFCSLFSFISAYNYIYYE